jgi:hypothetical protein
MKYGILRRRATPLLGVMAMLSLLIPPSVGAQDPQAPPRPPTPKAATPIDLTGYWVSVVTEDWRFRMITPDKGDYSSVPLNREGRMLADAWDPAKDQADGNQCRSYGAAAIMRVPGRLHIYWPDDNTLRIDTDTGTQTRVLHFTEAVPAEEVLEKVPEHVAATWQGYSVAEWEGLARRNFFGGLGGRDQSVTREGYLKVVTTRMRSGYLRKNGVPYSANALLEEYFDTFTETNADQWLVVTTIVTDPQYLVQPFLTSTHFKKIPDASRWNPSPCEAK